MNLVIDIGNTRVKIAVFNQDSIVSTTHLQLDRLVDTLTTLNTSYSQIGNCIVSTVIDVDEDIKQFLNLNYSTLWLSHTTRVPFKNNYKTPETLGIDRIALVCAAIQNHPNTNCLIIDAGTSITYDFVTAAKTYLGGAISLGLTMRYNALHEFTAKLPRLDKIEDYNLIGNATNTAIHSGVINGLLFEMEGFISTYKLKYSDLTVILTGGDAIFLSKQLKSSIFANSNFLLEGLNSILHYNTNR